MPDNVYLEALVMTIFFILLCVIIILSVGLLIYYSPHSLVVILGLISLVAVYSVSLEHIKYNRKIREMRRKRSSER